MSVLVVKSNDLHCFRSRLLKKADGTLSCTLNLVEGHFTEEIFSKNVKKKLLASLKMELRRL